MRPQSDGSARGGAHLQLLGWWHLTRGRDALHLGGREQRLVSLLALRGPRPRVLVAATLWPDTREDRARASLRTAVKQTQEHAPGLLEADRTTIGLSRRVRVDVHDLDHAIDDAIGSHVAEPARLLTVLRCDELLPGWYDDWVLYERERLEQQKVRALEMLATAAYDGGDLVTAVDAAREAIRIEPLLDTMRSVLIRARLGLGDTSGAVHEFRLYRRYLAQELGIEPPPALAALFEGTRPAPAGSSIPVPRPRRSGVVANGARSDRTRRTRGPA
ncbi:transcriptional regulator [Nocardioides guangzhouensis]|uniref:Transcriptional regulator n=1 Tax=Nocardioides guangzhouensis TaxID=2497878 RepID=A0A4Q4Z9L5_9ACTN|nr:transcriptional regulator [Nocardioides guangzhouensis]